jgi:hypothetical protein
MLISFPLQHTNPKSNNKTKLVSLITSHYKVSERDANTAVYYATKHTDESFPSKLDVLAIIAVESGFRSKAKSPTGVGYMQVFYRKTHSDSDNILAGVYLLKEYYGILKDKRATLLAYNAGISKYRKKRYTAAYYKKFLKEREIIKTMLEKETK